MLLKIKHLMLGIWSKITDYSTKNNEIENNITTDHIHAKYIAT